MRETRRHGSGACGAGGDKELLRVAELEGGVGGLEPVGCGNGVAGGILGVYWVGVLRVAELEGWCEWIEGVGDGDGMVGVRGECGECGDGLEGILDTCW